MSPPILRQIDETKSFYLKTDASDYALGAVLLQGEKENEHPLVCEPTSTAINHQALKWLFTLKSPTGWLARWALQLQPFNINCGNTPGKKNVVADTLSRPPCSNESHCEIKCECFTIFVDFPL